MFADVIYPSPASSTNIVVECAIIFRCPEWFVCFDRVIRSVSPRIMCPKQIKIIFTVPNQAVLMDLRCLKCTLRTSGKRFTKLT